jgi:CBS domain-containing protein
MPFIVQQLIEGRGMPITAQSHERVRDAVDRMVENDYSQLPVVDDDYRPVGMITSDSALHALNNFRVTPEDLRVADAMVKASKFQADDDLFDMLDVLGTSYAVLILDRDGRLAGIVTSYDAMEYFRRRAEDMMLVEDIESALKDHIRAAFIDVHGELNSDALTAAIADVTDQNRDLSKRFKRALGQYLAQEGNGTKLNDKLADETFANALATQGQSKALEDLTLYEYVQLLLHKGNEAKVNLAFGLPPTAIRTLLDGVRETRNALAHFRGQISLRERSRLRYAADWLARHQPIVAVPTIIEAIAQSQAEPVALVEAVTVSVASEIANTEPLGPAVDEIAATKEGGRYALLAQRLLAESPDTAKVALTFREIEAIIGDTLPSSSRRHRAWWSNNTEDRPQAEQWLAAGWRIENVNIDEETIVFTRLKAQQKRYIAFFGG